MFTLLALVVSMASITVVATIPYFDAPCGNNYDLSLAVKVGSKGYQALSHPRHRRGWYPRNIDCKRTFVSHLI